MSKSEEAALALAEAFFRCVPKDKKKRMSEAEWTFALQRFHKEALALRQQFRLGMVGRVMTTYKFQQRMLAAGFDADIVRKVVFSMVLNAFSFGA